jgi:hypothetical protein
LSHSASSFILSAGKFIFAFGVLMVILGAFSKNS